MIFVIFLSFIYYFFLAVGTEERSYPMQQETILAIIPHGSRIHCAGSERGNLPLIVVVVMVVVGGEAGEASCVRCLRAKAGSARSKLFPADPAFTVMAANAEIAP